VVPVAEAGRVHDADVPGLAASVRPGGAWQQHGSHGPDRRKTDEGCGGQGLGTPRIKSRGTGHVQRGQRHPAA